MMWSADCSIGLSTIHAEVFTAMQCFSSGRGGLRAHLPNLSAEQVCKLGEKLEERGLAAVAQCCPSQVSNQDATHFGVRHLDFLHEFQLKGCAPRKASSRQAVPKQKHK